MACQPVPHFALIVDCPDHYFDVVAPTLAQDSDHSKPVLDGNPGGPARLYAGQGPDVYTTQLQLNLQGRLEEARLKGAVGALLQRHASLQVIFMTQSLERAGDHAKNLAEEVCHFVSGHTVRHVMMTYDKPIEQMFLDWLRQRDDKH